MGCTFQFQDDLQDVWGEVSAVVNVFNFSETASVFAKLDYTFGEDISGLGGKVGIRVSWQSANRTLLRSWRLRCTISGHALLWGTIWRVSSGYQQILQHSVESDSGFLTSTGMGPIPARENGRDRRDVRCRLSFCCWLPPWWRHLAFGGRSKASSVRFSVVVLLGLLALLTVSFLVAWLMRP